MGHLYKLLIAFSLFLRCYSYGQTIIYKDASSFMNIGKSIYVFEDKSGQLTIKDINSENYYSKFRKSTQDIPNLGITKSAYWVRFDAENISDDDLYLEIENCNMEKIDFFKINNNNILTSINAGSFQNFYDRPIKSIFYSFPLANREEKEKTTFFLRLQYERGIQFPINIGSLKAIMEKSHKYDFPQGIYFGFMIVMLIYNLILFFSIRDRSYLYYVFYVFSMGLLNAVIRGYAFEYFWPGTPVLNKYGDVVSCLAGISGIVFATNFLNTSSYTPGLHKVFRLIFLTYLLLLPMIFTGNFLLSSILMEIVSLILIILFFITSIVILRKGYKPARFFLIAWSLLLISVVIFIFKDNMILPNNDFTENSMQLGSAIEAALLSLALANRINVYKKESEIAQQEYLKSVEANRKLVMEQNIILEQKVETRTRELKETQLNLIRQEKLASLGQLTAGIAHEIKNPLNFVNNFSEVSSDLIEDIKLSKNENERTEILNNIKNNLLKISHHGKRADNIVESMLSHSRNNITEKKETDINNLCDQCLKLSFNELQNKYPGLKCELNIKLDPEIQHINVIPFDINRVLVNIYDNAFYAVYQKSKNEANYNPVVTITTLKNQNKIVITVSDNGIGIPENQKEKIFNPFFTTKPAGQGAGLGLSMSYDIIIAHGGNIILDNSKRDETKFIIELPLNA